MIDGASLRWFRLIFGALMAFAVVRFAAHGWIAEYYLLPRYFFPFPGLDFIRPWPGAGMYVHYAVMLAAAVGMALGSRISALVFAVLFTWAHLIDRTNYLNHYHLISLLALMLALLPKGEKVPAWAVRLLQAQIGLVYLFGGLAKIQPDWLLRGEPLATWLLRNQDFPVIGAYFASSGAAIALSWAAAIFDLSIVPLLLCARTRGPAYVVLVLFHLMTARLFDIGMFPWIMIGASLIYFPPDWPRRARAWLRGAPPLPLAARLPWVPRWIFAPIALQALFALRGPIDLWSEDGFRFAWRVMVMEKNGALTMRVRDPDDGREWRVQPRDYLTPLQARMVATQPDMILAFAHLVDARMRERGVRDPEVRADAMVSLNGRPARRLMNPSVDLSREDDAQKWVLEMTP